MTTEPIGHPVLLYDGMCGFCDRAAQFILAHDKRGTMQFAPLQGEYASRLFERFPALRGVDSLVLVQSTPGGGETVSVRSVAVRAIAAYLGGAWSILALPLHLLPAALLDRAYDTFARRRIRFFGRLDACRLPSPEQRARFLD